MQVRKEQQDKLKVQKATFPLHLCEEDLKSGHTSVYAHQYMGQMDSSKSTSARLTGENEYELF